MITLGEAMAVLKQQALGIGEDHTQPAARQLVIELLCAPGRPVNSLFVEIPEGRQNMVEKAIAGWRTKGADPVGLLDCVGIFRFDSQNCYTLPRVMATAIQRGVYVYCIDDRFGNAGNRGNSARNQTIIDNFERITKGRVKGCVLLFGDDHFSNRADGPTLCQSISGMYYAKMCR